MNRINPCLLLSAALCVGCSGETTSSEDSEDTVPLVQIAASENAMALSGENTKIEFVGTHVGEEPDPRKGGFAELTGSIKTAGDGSVEAISVEIQTGSLWSEVDKLTDHLKSADFFDTREFPTAQFDSTQIVAGADGEVTVTGNLTLLGKTREISFPATVNVSDDSVNLAAKFAVDRTDFGMDYGLEKVEKAVEMTVNVQ